MSAAVPEIEVYTVAGHRIEPLEIFEDTTADDLKKQLRHLLAVPRFRQTLLQGTELVEGDCLLEHLPRPVRLTVVQRAYLHEHYSALRKAVLEALHTGGAAEAEVERLLALGQCPDPASSSNLTATPLQLAAQFGKETLALLLLEAGASMEPAHEVQESPLRMAAKARQGGMVRLLLEHGADVSRHGPDGFDALGSAADANAVEAARHLCEAGASASAVSAALLVALQRKHLELAQLLCKHGAHLHPRRASQLFRDQLLREWLSFCVPMFLLFLLGITWVAEWQRSAANALMLFAVAETASSCVLWLQDALGGKSSGKQGTKWIRGGIALGEALAALLWFIEALDALVALAMGGLVLWVCSTSLVRFTMTLVQASLPINKTEWRSFGPSGSQLPRPPVSSEASKAKTD